MTPSVICLAIFIIVLMHKRQRRVVLSLKNEIWTRAATERKVTYDRAWSDGYGFRKGVERVVLEAALDHVQEGDLEMSNKDRLSILIARLLAKIEREYGWFNQTMIDTGNDSVVNKVTFYTTMIQLMKDNPAGAGTEAAEVERHVIRQLINMRNEATKEIVRKYQNSETPA